MILIPAHNEAASIGSVLRSLTQNHPDLEPVVVASCCQDATAEIAKYYGATVLTEKKIGYGQALLCGYRYAILQDKDFLIQLDADGQHPPFLIHQILSNLHEGRTDWVIASRQNTGCGGPLLRRAGSAVVGALSRGLGTKGLYDISSGFWGLRKGIIRFFLHSFPDVIDANLRLIADRAGFCLQEISLPMEERYTGNSMHSGIGSLKSGLESIWALLLAHRETRRQRENRI